MYMYKMESKVRERYCSIMTHEKRNISLNLYVIKIKSQVYRNIILCSITNCAVVEFCSEDYLLSYLILKARHN